MSTESLQKATDFPQGTHKKHERRALNFTVEHHKVTVTLEHNIGTITLEQHAELVGLVQVGMRNTHYTTDPAATKAGRTA